MKSATMIFGFVFVLLASFCVLAQSDIKPFGGFDKEVKQEKWGGNKERLSSLFNAERKRLGPNFDRELLKYISGEVERHYWISIFPEEPAYLHGNEPLPYLSPLIKQQGLSLVASKVNDDESLGYSVGLDVTAAVLSEKLGLRALAISYKTAAETLLKSRPELTMHFPAMNETERKIYQDLKTRISPTIFTTPPNVPFKDEPKTRMFRGVINGLSSKLAMPKYPPAARADRASGTITVKVVVDETGSVIWARAMEEHPALKDAAEKAAYLSKFRPPMFEGKSEKLSGFPIYRFGLWSIGEVR